jgi:hypothetical protein
VVTHDDVQDSQENGEPKFLRTQKAVGVGMPFSTFDVVGVANDYENPSHLVQVRVGLIKVNTKLHTATPSHPTKRWCFSNTLWYVLDNTLITQLLKRTASTHLRIQGKALKTEIMIKTLVIIPLAITAGC